MRIYGVLALTACLLAAPALRAETHPHQILTEISDGFRNALQSERELIESNPQRLRYWVEQLVLPHVDLERMSRLTLGKYWRRATDEQKARFTKEYSDLLFNTYAKAYEKIPDWELVLYPLNLKPKQTQTLVKTELRVANGPALAINYRFYLENGEWKAYDLAVEGISLVTNYRTTFTREIKRRGLDGLIDYMAKHNQKTKTQTTTES